MFADDALSGALFGGDRDGKLAFSGPSRAPRAPQQTSAQEGPGGYVCMRLGAVARLAQGDPIARFAFCHEIGRRILGQGATPFFHERHGKDAAMVAAPGLRRRGVSRERLQRVVGAPHPEAADGPPPLRPALAEKTAASLFAFCLLTEPEAFSPAVDRLDQWAAHYGAPASVALAFYRQAPTLFGPGGVQAGFLEQTATPVSRAVRFSR